MFPGCDVVARFYSAGKLGSTPKANILVLGPSSGSEHAYEVVSSAAAGAKNRQITEPDKK
jgi:hypothetical protein